MYSLQFSSIAFEVFRHQVMRDLVDFPGQEFIYVELELHLGKLRPLLPFGSYAFPRSRRPRRRRIFRAGKHVNSPRWMAATVFSTLPGVTRARLEYGRCPRTLLTTVLLRVVDCHVSIDRFAYSLPLSLLSIFFLAFLPAVFSLLPYGKLLSLTQNLARESRIEEHLCATLRSSRGCTDTTVRPVYFSIVSRSGIILGNMRIFPCEVINTPFSPIDHFSLFASLAKARPFRPRERRRKTPRIDRAQPPHNPRSLHGSRPTDSRRIASCTRERNTRIPPPRPSFAGERRTDKCDLTFVQTRLRNACAI